MSRLVHNEILDTIYSAPACPPLWGDILTACIDLAGADSGWVNELDRSNRFGGEGIVKGVDAVEQERYFQYYAKLDPFRFEEGPPVTLDMWSDERFIAKQDLVRTEFYADFMSPIKVHSILILRMFDDGVVTRSMHLNFDRRRDWSASAGWPNLQALYKHLKRAAALSREIRAMERKAAALGQAFDETADGVIMLDARGRICFASDGAAAHLRRGSGLAVDQDRLTAAHVACAAELEALIKLATDPRRAYHAGGIMHVPVSGQRLPMIVAVTPLEISSRRAGEPAAIVTIRDPSGAASPPEQLIARVFGLTPAEATAAMLLVNGFSPQQIADELRLSCNTVRNQLKQVYSKVDVSRQSDLVSILLKFGAGSSAANTRKCGDRRSS